MGGCWRAYLLSRHLWGRRCIDGTVFLASFLSFPGLVPANEDSALFVNHARFDQLAELLLGRTFRVFPDQALQRSGDFFVRHGFSPRSSWIRMHPTSRTAI